MHNGINKKDLGLLEIKSYIWQNIIWVNINGNAPNFEEHMSVAISRWSEFNQKQYHGGRDSKFKLKLKCNWKLAVENYCESYHLPWVHPDLNSYSRLQDHYNIEIQDFIQDKVLYFINKLKDQKKLNFQILKIYQRNGRSLQNI